MTNISQLGNKLSEQKITQRIIIDANSTGEAEIPIPTTASVYLKGYGYTWYANQRYTLHAGTTIFPTRSDQEGSITQPVIYGNPFFCNSGGTLKLVIENNDSSAHTFDVVFYILTTEILDVESSGSDLTFNTGLNITSNINAVSQISYPSAITTVGVIQNMFDLDSSTSFEMRVPPQEDLNTQLLPRVNFSFSQSKTIQALNYDIDLITAGATGFTNYDVLVGYDSVGTTSDTTTIYTRANLSSTGSTTSAGGITNFYPVKTLKIVSVTKSGSCTATRCIIRFRDFGATISTANFSGDVATFSTPVELEQDVGYDIIVDNSGSSYTFHYGQATGSGEPVLFTAGYRTAGGGVADNIISFDVQFVDFQVLASHSTNTNISRSFLNIVTDKIYFLTTAYLKIKQINIFT